MFEAGCILNFCHFQQYIFSKFIFHQQKTMKTLYREIKIFLGGGAGGGLFKVGSLLTFLAIRGVLIQGVHLFKLIEYI